MMKFHIHETQLDEHLYAACGRSDKNIVLDDEFEAIDPENRCYFCDKYWFPRGQSESDLKYAKDNWNEKKNV